MTSPQSLFLAPTLLRQQSRVLLNKEKFIPVIPTEEDCATSGGIPYVTVLRDPSATVGMTVMRKSYFNKTLRVIGEFVCSPPSMAAANECIFLTRSILVNTLAVDIFFDGFFYTSLRAPSGRGNLIRRDVTLTRLPQSLLLLTQ